MAPIPLHTARHRIAYASAPPTVERVLHHRRWRLSSRCGCGGGGAFVRVVSVYVVLSTISADHVAYRPGQCKLKAGEERKRVCEKGGEERRARRDKLTHDWNSSKILNHIGIQLEKRVPRGVGT